MRSQTLRLMLAIMVVAPAIVGLYIPAQASIPLAVDISDGYTFSGVQRSIKSGAVEFFEESPIGPFTVSGERGFVQLSSNLGQTDSYLNCDPEQFIRSRSETIQNRQTNHYSVDLSSTSGQIESVFVGVPVVDNAGSGTTTVFPLDAVTVTLTFLSPAGDEVTVTLTAVSPNPGEAARYYATFNPPLAAGGVFPFDIEFTGEVEPPLSGNPQTSSLNCPTPNDDLEESMDFGLSQIFLRDPYVVVNVADPSSVPAPNPIPDQTLDEGESVDVPVSTTAPGSNLTLTVSGAPFVQIINDSGDGSGDLRIAPGFDDAGVYTVTLRVRDDIDPSQFSEDTFTVWVNDVNRAPVVEDISDVRLNVGETATIPVNTSDPDGDAVDLAFQPPVPFCIIPGHEHLECSPEEGHVGTHTVTVVATDDGAPNLSDDETFDITVNGPPVLGSIEDQDVVEGEELFGTLTATDPNGDLVSFSATGLPPFCTLTDNGDNTAFLECNPGDGDEGDYQVTVVVSDDGNLRDTETFVIRVREPNSPPVLNDINSITQNEGVSTVVTISGSDPDGDSLTLTADLPPFGKLRDNGDGTGSIEFNPSFDDAGHYTVTVELTDDGNPNLSVVKRFTITVFDVADPDAKTFDGLESLVRDRVFNPIVERVLVTLVSLAEFFAERGNDRAAGALLEAFTRTVEPLPVTLIDPISKLGLLLYAEELLDQLDY